MNALKYLSISSLAAIFLSLALSCNPRATYAETNSGVQERGPTTENDPRLHSDGSPWGLKQSDEQDGSLPRVLLIGDSILNGYHSYVSDALQGKAVVDRWVNPHYQSKQFNQELSKVLGNADYDVVLFNVGLHGWQEGRIPKKQFKPLTRSFVKVLQTKQPQAKLIWASTTPVTAEGNPEQLEPKINPVIVEHNRLAAEVMHDMGVPIADYYGLLVDQLELARGDRFHWRAPAYKLLASRATEVIRAKLVSLGDVGDPPVNAPFEKLDTFCVNDWWNRPANRIVDLHVPRNQTVAFGIYTVADQTLKLTAQLYPLYPNETRTVRLELKQDGEWNEVATAEANDLGWSAHFRIESWDDSRDVPYRIRHGEEATFMGIIRKNPVEKREIRVAVLSCNSSRDRGMRPNYVRNLRAQDPDLLFFAGDQSYHHREHTAAWIKFGLQFRDAFRDRPCVTIPDDHDIGHPNLWGEGGKASTRPDGSDGGYFFSPDYVNMVERCQTWHLPDPIDPDPIERGIGVYFTRMRYAGLDFAIVEDRKFKSGPAGKIPTLGPRPDHVSTPDYDPQSLDQAGLTLLGERQLEFLRQWSTDQQHSEPKVVLSQTPFCAGPHLHGKKDNRLYADLDSNGWPQTPRNNALTIIRKAGAVHLAGDQHIAMVMQYGVEQHRDSGWVFASPAIVNSIYGRWWAPLESMRAGPEIEDDGLPLTGDFLDGFGNKVTMHAYANPQPGDQDYGAGYGMARFNKPENTVTFECWPRSTDVTDPDARQFPGWPRTVKLKKQW